MGIEEVIQKSIGLMNYASQWFQSNIGSGLINFLKALLNLVVVILGYTIDIIRWVINHL